MTSVKLNDREWDTLFDEPDHLLKMYVGIRRHMDYKTGISGYSRRLSEHFFRELISYSSRAGRKACAVTRSKIRNGLSVLEKLGLITPIDIYVFKCPLADWDNCAPNKYDQAPTTPTADPPATASTRSETTNQLYIKGIALRQPPEPRRDPPPPSVASYDPPPATGYLPENNHIANRTLSPSHTCSPPMAASMFEEFWRLYPRKDGRKKAHAIWQRKQLDRVFPRIQQDLQSRIWRGDRYTPLPATYLNQERWLDETKGESNHGLSDPYPRPLSRGIHRHPTTAQRVADCWDDLSDPDQQPVADHGLTLTVTPN